MVGHSQSESENMKENVNTKSNGGQRVNGQNGQYAKPVQNPWKSSNGKSQDIGKLEEQERKASTQSVNMSYSSNGVDKGYTNPKTSFQQNTPAPTQGSAMAVTVSSGELSAASKETVEPENELPKSGSLVGLRSMFENQSADSSSSRSSRSGPAKSTSSSSMSVSSASSLPKSKSDNFHPPVQATATSYQAPVSGKAPSTQSTAEPVSRQSTAEPRQYSAQYSMDTKPRKGGKMPWYKQVSQMAYDGPTAISAVPRDTTRRQNSTQPQYQGNTTANTAANRGGNGGPAAYHVNTAVNRDNGTVANTAGYRGGSAVNQGSTSQHSSALKVNLGSTNGQPPKQQSQNADSRSWQAGNTPAWRAGKGFFFPLYHKTVSFFSWYGEVLVQ
jgi:hypothetical protein